MVFHIQIECLSPVATAAAGVEHQACGAVLLVGVSLAALVEVVLVGGVGEESVGLAGAESRASAAAATSAAAAASTRIDWFDHGLSARGTAYLEGTESNF